MDFKELCQFFGGTIFTEESRGDLKKLRADLTNKEESLRTSQDLNEEAAVVLIRAVWQIQSGEFRKAREDLRLLDDEKYGQRWKFRAKLYKALCWLWSNFPPLFKYDSRISTDAVLVASNQTGKKILGFTNNWQYITKYRLETLYKLSNIDILEYDIIRVLTSLSIGQMDNFRMLNPASRYFIDDAVNTRECNEAIPQTQANVRVLQRLANHLRLERVATYLERILYETAKAAGNIPEMVEHLGSMRSQYLAAADWHGLGVYEMLRGDAIVSPDLTSPLMMNFKADIHVADDEFGGFARQSWGLCDDVTSQDCVLMQGETDMYRGLCDTLCRTHLPLDFGKEMQGLLCGMPMPEDNSGVTGVLTASYHYIRAIAFFQQANDLSGSGSSRGAAKALLSLACIFRLHAWQPGSLHDPNAETDKADIMALSLLSRAKGLLEQTGDGDMSNLVSVHQLLSLTDIEEKAPMRAVGRWLQSSGSDALASFLGLLPYRMGIHFRYICGDLHKALYCFDLSRQLLARTFLLRDTWSRVQIAEAQCLIDLGKNLTAKSLSSALKGKFPIFSTIMNPNGGSGITNSSDRAQSNDYNPLDSLLGLHAGAREEDIEGAIDALISNPDILARYTAKAGSRIDYQRFVGGVGDAFRDEKPNEMDTLAYFGLSRHSLLREVDVVLKIDAIVSDPDCFPDQQTIEVLDAINTKDAPASWLQPGWQKSRAHEVVYRRTMRKWNLSICSGDLQTAQRVLQQYLDRTSRAPPSELLGKTYLIDVLRKSGHLMEAQKMASQLSSSEMLPNENDSPQSEFDRALILERRIMKSKEVIFHSQVNAAAWNQAKISMEGLEDSSPGYFTSVSCYSQYLPWQRCFSAGLVYEGLGEHQIAWKYFFQAWEFMRHLRSGLKEANDRRALAENGDFGRLINSLVRILLIQSKSEDSGKCLASGIHTRVDTKIFTAFEGKESIFLWQNGFRFSRLSALVILEGSRAQYVSDMMIASVRDEFDFDVRQISYDQTLFEGYFARVESLTKEEEVEFQRVKDLQGVDGVMEQRLKELNLKQHAAGFREGPDDSNFDSTLATIPNDALVIYTSLSEDGLCIFALQTSEILYGQWRSDLTSPQIRENVHSYLSVVEQDIGQNAQEDCLLFIQELSEILLGAFHDMIALKSHIIFVPSGDLTRLPLGALLYNGEPLILQKAVSQTPSLSYLRVVLNSKEHQIPPRTSVIAKAGLPRQNDIEVPLPFAGIEGLMISHLYSSSQPLAANDLTRDNFRNEMETSTILHLSTHGNLNPSSPLMSSISLAEKYRVIDLSLIRVRTVELAIFSACLTGQGQATPSSDVLGFSHAMLASGATVYIGALWTANDVVTMIHMYLFHLCMLSDADKSIAENWAQATRELYRMSHEDAANMLKLFVEIWDELKRDGRQPDNFVPGGKKLLQTAIRRLGTRRGKRELNFTHPYFWAPFSVVGNGGLVSLSVSGGRRT